jgi:hypothetical protein
VGHSVGLGFTKEKSHTDGNLHCISALADMCALNWPADVCFPMFREKSMHLQPPWEYANTRHKTRSSSRTHTKQFPDSQGLNVTVQFFCALKKETRVKEPITLHGGRMTSPMPLR